MFKTEQVPTELFEDKSDAYLLAYRLTLALAENGTQSDKPEYLALSFAHLYKTFAEITEGENELNSNK